MMEREWRAILARYGQEMTLHHKTGERHLVRAFFQPVLDKGEEQEVPSPWACGGRNDFCTWGPVPAFWSLAMRWSGWVGATGFNRPTR